LKETKLTTFAANIRALICSYLGETTHYKDDTRQRILVNSSIIVSQNIRTCAMQNILNATRVQS